MNFQLGCTGVDARAYIRQNTFSFNICSKYVP
jgi:hypothetical protein